jgi:hypothetical protein
MKNILAENLLRFAPKNLTESEKKNLSKLTEQADMTDVSDLGEQLLRRITKDGIYTLDLSDVNILLTRKVQDLSTVSSNDAVFKTAYGTPIYVMRSINKIIFIGTKLQGGPIQMNKKWTPISGLYICQPNITKDGISTNVIEQQLSNKTIDAYKQIYNFTTEGYRNNNKQITDLMLFLEKQQILPSIEQSINNTTVYKTFLANRHDDVMKML